MTLSVVQIGSNKVYDDLTTILKYLPSNLIDKLILLEPLKVHHESLKKCYSHIKNKFILGNIITTEKINEGKDVDLWYHLDDGPGYEVASINKDHIKKQSFINPAFEDESRYRKITSIAITLNSLFEAQDIKDIDILFIDAEGLDSDIIKSIDFDVYDIKNIFFENLHLPEGRQNPKAFIYKFLIEKVGMKVNLRCLSNGWMSHAWKD